MMWPRRIVAIIRGLLRRNAVADEIREEMQFHIDARADEYRRQGLDAAQAKHAAQRQFGNPAVLRDEGYDIRGAGVWDSLWQDVRYAARRLRATPGFTIATVLTLALGIGANASIFSLMNGVLLRGVPGASLDRVATVFGTSRGVPDPISGLTNDLRESLAAQHLEAIESFFTSDPLLAAVFSGDRSGFLSCEVVSGSYFASLGLAPTEGRLLDSADDRDVGDGTPVVISQRLRRSWFGNDSAVGKVLRIGGTTLAIVGVAPEPFRGTWLPTIMSVDVWIPSAAADRVRTFQGTPVAGPHRTFVKLRPGYSLLQGDTSVRVAGRSAPSLDADRALTLLPAERGIFIADFQRAGLTIGVALVSLSALVFLIACANLTNLLLARTISRSSEIATRLALGAGRTRVFRLLFTEAVLLAAMAAGAAVVLTMATTALMTRVPLPMLEGIAIRFDPSPDWRVFGYALAIAVVAALGVGLAPAWRASRTDPLRTIAANGPRGGESRRGRRFRMVLVAAQVAMSVVLLLTAGLYVRSSIRANGFDPGYDTRHAALASIDLRFSRLDEAHGRLVQRRMIEAAARIPSVTRALLTSGLSGATKNSVVPLPDGAAPGPGVSVLPAPGARAPVRVLSAGALVQYADVSPGTLGALGIRLHRGRDFTDTDELGAPPVAIVSESLARRLWPGQDPLGQHLQLKVGGGLLEVVGVADAISMRLGTDPFNGQFVYLPIWQDYSPQLSLLAVTAGDPAALVEPLRRAMSSVDPDLPLLETKVLAEGLDLILAPLRVITLVVGSLGLLGLGIAVIGLHGVTTYFVSQRTREFGIRRALGATARGIYAVVLRAGFQMLLLGIVTGVPAALAVSGLLRTLLYGISPHDPVTFVGVPLLLVTVGLASSCIAARRAARVEPAEALRDL